jgi:hypothetical protein
MFDGRLFQMDIKTLVVGQDVSMVSGPYCCRGKVVKVTPEGVEVWIDLGPKKNGMLLKFDKNGKECTFDKQKYPNAWMGTYEGGPWELVAQI